MTLSFDKNAVCVLCKLTQDGECIGIGTGFFFMEDDLVATCKHIMEDHAKNQVPYSLVIRPSQSTEGCLAVQCVYHIEQDMALIKLERRYHVRPFVPCIGTNNGFTYVGFDPLSRSLVVRHIPTFYTPDAWEGSHSTIYFFEWDGSLTPGNSGGPLIGSDGGVAGMLIGFSSQVDRSDKVQTAQSRARAIFTGPLTDLYLRWKFDTDSLRIVENPFT